MSTKTCAKTNDGKSTKKSIRNMFPMIQVSNKSTPSMILERILEIERTKKINKLNLEREL